jgi:aryl-alcohol dehydrogenase-like predicted oxidoreductase
MVTQTNYVLQRARVRENKLKETNRMRKRKLGRTDLEVPVIMLGGNVFGWTLGEAGSFELLDRAMDAGLNFIDTADVYSKWAPGNHGGESETILGKWFARSGKRDRVVLATKVGIDMGDGKQGLSAKYIERAVEDSLRRLQTDRIDLYQSHKDDETTPFEETLGAYEKLIRAGKVRCIGASNYSGARLREALETSVRNGLPRYESLQPLYNLMERDKYESDLAPVVAEFGLGVVPYYSLASGFLTGKYRQPADAQGRPRAAGVQKYLNDRGFAVLKALDSVAAAYHASPASVALAWLIAQPGITAPIASATSPQQLDDFVAALDLKLDSASVEKLTAASAV